MERQVYHLYVKLAGLWVFRCELQAVSHADALFQAKAWLTLERDETPFRLESVERSVTDGPPRRPIGLGPRRRSDEPDLVH